MAAATCHVRRVSGKLTTAATDSDPRREAAPHRARYTPGACRIDGRGQTLADAALGTVVHRARPTRRASSDAGQSGLIPGDGGRGVPAAGPRVPTSSPPAGAPT